MTKSLNKSDLVLIIDDDETVLNVTQQIVMRCGFATTVASSGLEGLAKLEELGLGISCIMLDMSMPEMDGAMVFDEILKIQPEIPVLIISGYTEHDLKTRFKKQQPFAFLQKPFSITDLDARLREAAKEKAGKAEVGRYSGPLPPARPLARP